MKLKRLIAGVALSGVLGAAAAVGLGAGMASAEPTHQVPGWVQPGRAEPPQPGPGWVQPGRPDIRPEDRDGYVRADRDHRPFRYQGHWVNPVFDAGHQGWGFWLGPIWIPLI